MVERKVKGNKNEEEINISLESATHTSPTRWPVHDCSC